MSAQFVAEFNFARNAGNWQQRDDAAREACREFTEKLRTVVGDSLSAAVFSSPGSGSIDFLSGDSSSLASTAPTSQEFDSESDESMKDLREPPASSFPENNLQSRPPYAVVDVDDKQVRKQDLGKKDRVDVVDSVSGAETDDEGGR